MKLKETLMLAWRNRASIAEGFYNRYLSMNTEIKQEAARRKAICESNRCGYYDAEGKPETSAISGKPACSICHCNIDIKVSCMYCWCALEDLQVNKMKEMEQREELSLDIDTSDSKQCHDKVRELTAHGVDLGPGPLWTEIITEEMDKNIRQTEWEQQFKK
jgi:hypothetical protein